MVCWLLAHVWTCRVPDIHDSTKAILIWSVGNSFGLPIIYRSIMSFHARKSDLRPENFKFSVLSLADLKSDISTGVGGEGVRDGRSAVETRGVGAARGGS